LPAASSVTASTRLPPSTVSAASAAPPSSAGGSVLARSERAIGAMISSEIERERIHRTSKEV